MHSRDVRLNGTQRYDLPYDSIRRHVEKGLPACAEIFQGAHALQLQSRFCLREQFTWGHWASGKLLITLPAKIGGP